jgi:hypothetical protein
MIVAIAMLIGWFGMAVFLFKTGHIYSGVFCLLCASFIEYKREETK